MKTKTEITKTLRASLENINIICEEIKAMIDNKTHIIILLQGEIGAGKTTLVKAYVKFIGLDSCVTSPTFMLQHCYDSRIYHYDLYNRDLKDLLALGLMDLLAEDGVHFVEWGEGLLERIKEAYSNVQLISIERFKDYANYHFKD